MPPIPYSSPRQYVLSMFRRLFTHSKAPSLPSRDQEKNKSDDNSQNYKPLLSLILALISTHNGGRRKSLGDGIDGRIWNSYFIPGAIVIGPYPHTPLFVDFPQGVEKFTVNTVKG